MVGFWEVLCLILLVSLSNWVCFVLGTRKYQDKIISFNEKPIQVEDVPDDFNVPDEAYEKAVKAWKHGEEYSETG